MEYGDRRPDMDKGDQHSGMKKEFTQSGTLAWRIMKARDKAHKQYVHRILAERPRLRYEKTS